MSAFYHRHECRCLTARRINPELMLAQRLEYKERWPGILQQLLGDSFLIVEAGLNGRTTAFNEINIVRPSRNGLSTLPVILPDWHWKRPRKR